MSGRHASDQARFWSPGSGGDGDALVLTAPISFWGGVDPKTRPDRRCPAPAAWRDRHRGTVLFLPGTIGSSSASAVLLELVHAGHAPAALVLHEPDAILLLGLIVAREMGWATPVAVKLDRDAACRFRRTRVKWSPTDGSCRCHRKAESVVRSGSAARGPAGGGRRRRRGC